MVTRRGAVPRAVATSGLVVVLAGLAGATHRVDAQTPTAALVGYSASATSDGTGFTFGDPGAQPYPVGAGQQNHTEATIATGPAGYALASTAWPGPLVGNAGSLAVLLGGPSQAGELNYGGRAEAFSPAGPNDASLPSMVAHTADGVSEATAGSQGVSTGTDTSQASTADSTTISRAALEGTTVSATTSSTTSDLAFAAGAVTIGSVHTEALATTDGVTSTVGGQTIVSGGSAGGSPFTVDEEGVRFTDPVTAPIGEQVLAQAGIEMFVAKARETNEGDAASYRSGALVVLWEPPQSGYLLVYTFGGSEAEASARLGTAAAPPAPTTRPPTTTPPPAVPSGGSGSTGATPARPAATFPTPTTATAIVTPTADAAPVAFVWDLSWWWPYLLGAGFVVVASSRLRREQALLAEPAIATSTCPLDAKEHP